MLKLSGDISELRDLANALQAHGTRRNIVSVFDDGGFRELLMGELFGLELHKGRHGDDATDNDGKNYELKTVNLVDTSGKLRVSPGVTTCHHVNRDIISRYRKLHGWVIGIFFINEPVEIYELRPSTFKNHIDKWEARLKGEGLDHINNPKLPFREVRQKGKLHYQNKALTKKYIGGNLERGKIVFQDILKIKNDLA